MNDNYRSLKIGPDGEKLCHFCGKPRGEYGVCIANVDGIIETWKHIPPNSIAHFDCYLDYAIDFKLKDIK